MEIYNKDNVPSVTIKVEVMKGQTNKHEDFDRAEVFAFLVTRDNRYPMTASVNGGVITSVIPAGLPEGVYGYKAIWFKNGEARYVGGHSMCPPPVMPSMHADRSMRVEIDNIFSISSETGGSTAGTLTFKAAVASYGYDGLDAYELSVIRGKTQLSEGDWLDWMNTGSTPQPEPTQQDTRTEFPWAVEMEIESLDGAVPGVGGTYKYTAQARRKVIITHYDGREPETTYETDTATVLASANNLYTINGNFIAITENTTKAARDIRIEVQGNGAAEGKYLTKTVSQSTKDMLYLKSAVQEGNEALTFQENPAEISCNDYDFSIELGILGSVTGITTTKEGDWFAVGDYDSTTKSITVAPNDNNTTAVRNGVVIVKYNTTEQLRITIHQSYVTSEVYDAQLALSYDDIPSDGGKKTPTKSISWKKTIKRSNNYQEVLDVNDTTGQQVTFSGDYVNTTTGEVEYLFANSTTGRKQLTEVTMTVVLNGTTKSIKANVYQAKGTSYAYWGGGSAIPTTADTTNKKELGESGVTITATIGNKYKWVALPAGYVIKSWKDTEIGSPVTPKTGSQVVFNGVTCTIYYAQFMNEEVEYNIVIGK